MVQRIDTFINMVPDSDTEENKLNTRRLYYTLLTYKTVENIRFSVYNTYKGSTDKRLPG